jgi:hypothetical protein
MESGQCSGDMCRFAGQREQERCFVDGDHAKRSSTVVINSLVVAAAAAHLSTTRTTSGGGQGSKGCIDDSGYLAQQVVRCDNLCLPDLQD